MKDKVVLVTGANGGLGVYVTQAFLETGASVIGTSRKIQQSDFNSPGFTAMPAEISTREGAEVLVGQVVSVSAGLMSWRTRSVVSPVASRSRTPTTPPFSACSTST